MVRSCVDEMACHERVLLKWTIRHQAAYCVMIGRRHTDCKGGGDVQKCMLLNIQSAHLERGSLLEEAKEEMPERRAIGEVQRQAMVVLW